MAIDMGSVLDPNKVMAGFAQPFALHIMTAT
jgi:hypothetical protein